MTLKDEVRQVLAPMVDEAISAHMGTERTITQMVEDATEAVITKVQEWLRNDDLRPVVYDGLSSSGPTTQQVLEALATYAGDEPGYRAVAKEKHGEGWGA